jgi:hypothetical protein
MKEKTLLSILGIEAAICAVLAFLLPPGSQGGGYLMIAQFPFAQIGAVLRALSLATAAGNTAALILYFVFCLLPVAFVMVRIVKKRFLMEDILLFMLGGFCFYMLFIMVNPSYFVGNMGMLPGEMAKAVLGGVFYSILIGYIVLRLLRKADTTPTEKLLKTLRTTLGVMAAVLVLGICYLQVSEARAQIAQIQSANTDPSVSLNTTYVFAWMRFALLSLPYALELALFLRAMRLCGLLMEDRYSEAVILSATRLAQFCKRMVAAVLLSHIAFNLLQVIFSAQLVNANVQTTLPLDSIIVAFAALLLARLLSDSRRLRQDNDLII